MAEHHDSTLPKLLVMTYYAPDAHHGGAVCVQQMLDGYPRERLAWAHHDAPVTDPASPWSTVDQWSVALMRRPNRFGLHPLKEYGNWTLHAERMSDDIAARARQAGIEAVLGIGPGLSVWTSYLVSERLGVPLHLWIHDDPCAYATYRRHWKPLVSRVRRCFVRAYQAAAVRYVISQPMRYYYRGLTGCDAVLLPPSIGRLPRRRPRGDAAGAASRDRRLRIGLAGSICGMDVWESFLQALERLFESGGLEREPEVTVFADPHDVPVPSGVRERSWVRLAGWQAPEVVDETLAGMDYAYMPLWFDASRSLHVATSFSTKFVGYLRLGIPLLCHVPVYSAVAEFVRSYPVGPLLDTMDVDGLASRLRMAFTQDDWKRRLAAVWEGAVAEFDHNRLLTRFHRALREGKAATSSAESMTGGPYVAADADM